MSTSEVWLVGLGLAGLLTNFALFVVFALQLHELRRQVQASVDSISAAEGARSEDHALRRKQSTIEFYATTLEKRSQLRTILPYDRDSQAVRALLDKAATETDDIGKPVTEYLSLFELLATGVNTGVFDLDTIERVAGGRIRAIAKNYWPWTDYRRNQFDSPLLYEEIEQLAAILESRLAQRLADAQARRLAQEPPSAR